MIIMEYFTNGFIGLSEKSKLKELGNKEEEKLSFKRALFS